MNSTLQSILRIAIIIAVIMAVFYIFIFVKQLILWGIIALVAVLLFSFVSKKYMKK